MHHLYLHLSMHLTLISTFSFLCCSSVELITISSIGYLSRAIEYCVTSSAFETYRIIREKKLWPNIKIRLMAYFLL
jgi:hypothetical protein